MGWNFFNKKSSRSDPGEVSYASATSALSPPKETIGLRLLGIAPQDADIDIVAVHGLGGDAFETWTALNGKLWLRDFLPQQLEDPPEDSEYGPHDSKVARVMTFGYDASVGTKASSLRSFVFAEQLLVQLSDKRVSESSKTRPLMLVGHSLGGIVIKRALILAQARSSVYGDILRSVAHLCFFGTPHQGTDDSLGGFFRGLASTITRSDEGSVLKELRLWSKPIVDTNTHFADIAEGFTITTFLESEKYCGVLVVNEGSARLNKSKEKAVTLNRNHVTLCKFASTEESDYQVVFNRLHAEISAVGTPQQIQEQARRVELLLASVPPIPSEG
ncbi:hypothetical protein F5Y16DRAFT_379814 [Xylariaceae sp. FL0255]|nr:hypothetical protein F5Y16DRAFT_379814 [Xylariaceae sp. FL0255]